MILLLACAAPEPAPLALYLPEALFPVVAEHVLSLPHPVALAIGPVADGRVDGSVVAVLELDDRCDECFRVDPEGDGFRVRAGGTAGALYGIATLMEGHGWRFGHPFDTDVPDPPRLRDDAEFGVDLEPEIARRGLHLHTLHPTEAMFDVWADPNLPRARAMLDWIVRHRGNHVQWPGLDDIAENPALAETWRQSTASIVGSAHGRGMTAGIGVQLFGMSNLQEAYDLVDDEGSVEEDALALRERWPIVMDGIGWDTVSLSFGEFFSAEPDVFISRAELAYDTLQEVAPGVEMTATLHVGGNEEVQVEYDGQTMSYYYLVNYADRPITPWVHTVMYYNLYDDAGGAYGLDDFAEHRAFLEATLSAGEAVGYHPETAYWVAFDNSVPTYMPVYVYSRWHDLDQLRQRGLSLQDHVIFESGWEWGYAQNDAAALRMSYRLPTAATELFGMLLADDTLAAVADQAAVLQYDMLVQRRLAAYVAGRDIAMDVGEGLDIVSQPRRVLFEELAEMSAEERQAFGEEVLVPLALFADAHESLAGQLAGDDRWSNELRDGLLANTARARFVTYAYLAVAAHADGNETTGLLDEADAWYAEGQAIVARRHGAFHDPVGERLVERADNPTLYDYGYLYNADTLCFWARERGEVRELLLGEDWTDPGCTL